MIQGAGRWARGRELGAERVRVKVQLVTSGLIEIILFEKVGCLSKKRERRKLRGRRTPCLSSGGLLGR